jgi:hypothetical protein
VGVEQVRQMLEESLGTLSEEAKAPKEIILVLLGHEVGILGRISKDNTESSTGV